MVELNAFYFFTPIFGLLVILTIFWIFLSYGYSQINEKRTYMVFLINLLTVDFVSILLCLKTTNVISFLSWFNILGILSVLYGFNFLYFILKDMERKNVRTINNYNEFNEDSNSSDYYLAFIEVFHNICLILLFSLLGLHLDNNLKESRKIFLFLFFCISCLLTIFKYYCRNNRLKPPPCNEWKKAEII